MKKILVIGAMFIGLSAQSQQIFPDVDSLQKYINRHIRNSAISAFTNLRLNTALIGTSQFLGTGSGGNNTNIGSGFRLLNPGTQTLRTFGNGLYIIWDTATTGQLKANIDTASMPKTVFVDSSGITIRYGAPSAPGVPDTLVFSSTGGGGLTEGFGVDITGSVVRADTLVDKVASHYSLKDSIAASKRIINLIPQLVQGRIDNEHAASGANASIVLSDGSILSVYESRGSMQNDFFPAELYYSIIKENRVINMGPLPITITQQEMSIPNLYYGTNDTICMLFTGYESTSDNPIYKVRMKFNLTTYVPTVTTPEVINAPAVFQLIYHDRIITAADGNMYLPVSRHDGVSPISLSNAGSIYTGKVFKSTDNGVTWSLLALTITSPDNAVFESGIIEIPINFNESKDEGNKMLVYYWRNRSGKIMYVESSDDFVSVTAVKTAGFPGGVPNSPLVMRAYKDRVYAVINRNFPNATVQTEIRNQFDIYASSRGMEEFHSVARLSGNESDTLFQQAPSLHVLAGKLYASFSIAGTVAGEANLYMAEINKAILDGGNRDFTKRFAQLEIAGGNYVNGTLENKRYLSIFNTNGGSDNGNIMLGDFFNSGNNFMPKISSKMTPGYSYGLQFVDTVGNDADGGAGSAGLSIKVVKSDGTSPANIDLFSVENAGGKTFRAMASTSVWIGSRAGDPSTLIDGMIWYNSTLAKFRARQNGISVDMIGGGGGGSYTFQQSLTETAGTVNLTGDEATPAAYKLYGANGSGTRGFHSINTDYLSNFSITSPQDDQALVYFSATSNWRNAYVIRPGASALTSGTIPIASGNRTIDNSAITYDAGTGFNFGANKITLGNSLTVTSGAINTIISWDGGGVIGTSTNHILELWANGAKRAQLNQNGTLNYAADYTASMTTDRHIPDIGKVNSLITADVSPYATYVLVTDKTFSGTTAEVVTFDTEINEAGITHSTGTNPEEITFATAGVYTISFDAHVFSTATDNIKFSIQMWDGDSWEFLSNSAALGKVSVANNTNSVTLSYQSYFSASSKIRIVAAATTTNCTLNAIAADANGSEVPAARIVIKGHKAVAP
jgi:hypothetical protein